MCCVLAMHAAAYMERATKSAATRLCVAQSLKYQFTMYKGMKNWTCILCHIPVDPQQQAAACGDCGNVIELKCCRTLCLIL